MDAAEARDRILRFLDRHHRVPAGSMIRLGGLWACARCKGTDLIGAPGAGRFQCAACGGPAGPACRPLQPCACGSGRFLVASGDLYDADHYLEDEDLAAALCAECSEVRAIVRAPENPAVPGPSIRGMGESLDVRAIPELLVHYSDPALQEDVEAAIREIVAAAPSDPPPVPPEVAERMRRRIADLREPWPHSVAKDHGALPLHTSEGLFLWSIRPDGVLLESDLDTAMNNTEPRDHPLTRFAMMLRGIPSYPELAEFLHPPRGSAPCRLCRATGRGDRFSCGRCNGLGWVTT
jgi:hypothetical protein